MRDAYERIISFNQNRDARFLPMKYKLMASSAFRFFRGSCHLFYEDLAQNQTWDDQTVAWVCGDLHVENFGSYKSAQNVVYFDLNDFDEAALAHPTWEVIRFLSSVFLAGKELNLLEDDIKRITSTLLNDYLTALQLGKAFALEKETLDGILKKNDIEVFLSTSADEIEILGYPNELIQVIINLVSNSTYALKEQEIHKKIILIDIKEEDEKIFIRVRDNANGMEENILDKIFDFHFTTKKIKSKSSGLGLYMSQQLVKESMEGTLSVKNSEYYYEDKKYKGAEFIIQFPLSN